MPDSSFHHPSSDSSSAPSVAVRQHAGSDRAAAARYDGGPRGSEARGSAGENGGGAVGDLLYVWRAAWNHKWWVLAAFLLGVGIALAYSLLAEPTYQTYSATLINAEQKRVVGSNASNPLEEALSMQRSSRTMENELERLRQSIPLAEQVVAHLDSAALVREAGLDEEDEPPTRQRLAQYLLEERVSFKQSGEDVDVIQITATAPEPKAAARIARAYAEEYQRHSRKVSQTGAGASRAFLERQVAERRRELEETETELRQFMQESGAVALDEQSQSAVQQIASLDAQLEEARTNLEAERTALEELRGRIASIEPNLLRRVQSTAGSEIAALQQQIAELEARASNYYAQTPELRQNPEQNPELASLERRIENRRAQVEELANQQLEEVMAAGGLSGNEQQSGGAGGTQGLGYISELKREALRKDINVRALESRVEALRGQIGQYEGQLRNLPGQSVRLAQLRRAQQAAEETFLSLRRRLQEASIAEESQIGYVEIVRPALVPNVPVSPNARLNLLLGGLLGLALGVGAALLRQATDRQLHTPDDLHALGFDTLGLIPDHEADEDHAAIVERTPAGRHAAALPSSTPAAEARSADGGTLAPQQDHAREVPLFTILTTETEAFRHLRTNLQFGPSRGSDAPRVVAVTSPRMGEGKTSVALGLASVMARAGRRTLLIDADLRRPAGHRYLGLSRANGLTDLLQRGGPPENWDAFRLRSERDDFDNGRDNGHVFGGDGGAPAPGSAGEVFFLPAGSAVEHTTELLESPAMRAIIDRARKDFDMVILDTPPLLTVADPLLAATYCDATLLVAAAGQTSRDALLQARHRLESIRAAAPLAGVVLNRVAPGDAETAGYDYSYGRDADAHYHAEEHVSVAGT